MHYLWQQFPKNTEIKHLDGLHHACHNHYPNIFFCLNMPVKTTLIRIDHTGCGNLAAEVSEAMNAGDPKIG
ncbi:MAG: hypothetical protein H6849_00410 [Alphaproteobacteria bacterium]|nr:MAG: hypothetical protein H6849_00410 [Alphaproteobacteria bacterium]